MFSHRTGDLHDDDGGGGGSGDGGLRMNQYLSDKSYMKVSYDAGAVGTAVAVAVAILIYQ